MTPAAAGVFAFIRLFQAGKALDKQSAQFALCQEAGGYG
jgi:hypothetical protein